MQTTTSTTTAATPPKFPDPAKRNHFFYGKLMDAYHFELETGYLNAHRWLINRLVLGPGVVWGLDVVERSGGIVVTPGMAIDYWGREIIVSANSEVLEIPDHHVQSVAGAAKQHGRPQDCCIQVLLCYQECLTDPTPVIAGQCGCQSSCVAGAISESYCIKFKPGCAPPQDIRCPYPTAVSSTGIDYDELAKLVTRPRKHPDLPKDPCIPLANIPVDPTARKCCCGHDEIDISVRPIVFTNRLLFNLDLCTTLNTTI